MNKCICGNELSYEECCGKFLDNNEIAKTPVELMRSRYCAFVKQDINYLNLTSTSNIEKILHVENINWLSLKVHDFDDNTVTFSCFYKDADSIHVFKECSSFVIEEARLKYDSGKILHVEIKRNEPCPCGSGKKYKKCCGK